MIKQWDGGGTEWASGKQQTGEGPLQQSGERGLAQEVSRDNGVRCLESADELASGKTRAKKTPVLFSLSNWRMEEDGGVARWLKDDSIKGAHFNFGELNFECL